MVLKMIGLNSCQSSVLLYSFIIEMNHSTALVTDSLSKYIREKEAKTLDNETATNQVRQIKKKK